MIRTSELTQALIAPEAELVKQARQGDADAFARLYDAHINEVYQFIYYRVSSDRDTAEDLTSQVFLKAWHGLPRYQLRGVPFRAWLFQIARNLVIDYYRARKDEVSLEPYALSRPDPAVNVAREVENQLQTDWFRAKFQELTPEQREVLTLKFINGFSTKEIAGVMNKRQGAIRALQMRALQALAALIGTDNDEL